MALPPALCFTFFLLLMSVLELGPASAAGTPKKRSIQYAFRRTQPTRYWTTAPLTSLAGGQLLVDAGGLGTFSAPMESPLLPGMRSSVMSAPPEVAGLEPTPVAYLPLPALTAALRGLTPAAIGTGPVPAVCVHAHPMPATHATELTADDVLVPGGDSQAQTLRLLLGRLLPAARTAAAGGPQRPAVPDLSFLRELGLGLLKPSLFRTATAALSPSDMPEERLRAVAAAERSSVTERPSLTKGNPDSEMFPRSAMSAPTSGVPDNSEQLSRLLSAEWSNFIRTRRRKRSLPQSSQSETRHQMSAALGKIIRRIGFEKYGESLKLILQDLQPLKEALRAAQSDINKVQSTYQKFETDLNQLLEQSRGAQQILLFILSSLFQENIVTRRKLEECMTSNQVLTAELQVPRRNAELTTLRRQLGRKMRRYDALVLSLLTEKSALEVERQRLRQSCNIGVESGAEADPFSLSTLLSLMTGLGEPSGDQRDVSVLLMRLFPHLYPEPPPPPPATAAFKLTDAGRAGAGSGWLQVLVPFMRTRRPPAQSASGPVPLTAPPRDDVPLPFNRRFLLRRPPPPRTAPLTHRNSAPLPPAQSVDSGDQFVMRMLQLMLELYNAQPGQVDESKIKGELVGFGRLLLC